MKHFKKILILFTTLAIFFCINASAAMPKHDLPAAEKKYINQLVSRYNFKRQELESFFQRTQTNPEIIHRIERPYEKKTWPQYCALFITDKRIKNGVAFWKAHQATLKTAEKKFGVPAPIILAILGIETNFGYNKGTFPVFESLTTLSFHYKPRARFFKHELTEYLLLTKEQNLPTLKLKGSYAGAIGIPQFMPSAYRRYAISYKNNASANLSDNVDDAIMSTANYLKQSGWTKHQPIALALKNQAPISNRLISSSAKPRYALTRLKKYGINVPKPILQQHKRTKAAVINMDMGEQNKHNYWLTFANFRSIMDYNPRINYAMAVYKLSKSITNEYKKRTIGARTTAPSTGSAH